jgi:hypothetical protein
VCTGVLSEVHEYVVVPEWTCVGSVDCFRLRTVRGKDNIATNEPDFSAGVSLRSYPAG